MLGKLARMRWLSVACVAVMVATLVAGCGAPPTPAAPAQATNTPFATTVSQPAATVAPAATAAPPTNTPAPKKKVFVFGRYQDAITPDPVMNDANRDIWYMQQYYSGLLRFKRDNSLEGDLAEKWEISPDGLTYTFYLRPDIKFANGTPITAADWQWSLDRARNKDNGIWWFTLEAVDKVEATDKTVVFKLKEPYVPFIYSAAMFNSVVMPKDLVEKAGGWEKFMSSPVGAGPYIMKEWVKGDHMLLAKNPYYWDKGKPLVDEILIKNIPDDNTRILALQKGEVDAINFVPKSRVAELNKDSNIEVKLFPSTFTNYLTLNDRRKPFDDKRVRQALSYAIDRDVLLKMVNFGIGAPAKSFRPVGSLYHNDTLTGWPYDLEKAKSLLKEAGYEKGFKTTVQIIAGSESDLQLTTVIKDMWAKLGVTLDIQSLEGGLWNDNYNKNNFDIQINYWTDDLPDPSQETNYAVVYETSESFHSGFKSDEVTKLAKDALKEQDPEKRKAMYFRIQEIFNAELPFVPMWHEPLVVAVRKNVSNFHQTPLGTYIWRDLDVAK